MAEQAVFNVVKRPDLVPLCSHCGAVLNEVHSQSKGFPLWQGRHTVYFCPACRKVLGFSQGRMA